MAGMKSKTIASVISRKVEHWLKHVDDHQLRDRMRDDIIITGGCITSMLLGDKPNDFDVYFRTYETTLAVAKYYALGFAEKMKSRVKPIAVQVMETDDNEGRKRVKIKVFSAGAVGENSGQSDAPAYDFYEMSDDRGEGAQEMVDHLAENLNGKSEKEGDDKPAYRPVFISTNAISLANDVQVVLRFWGEPDEIHRNYDFVHCTNYWTRERGLRLNDKALAATLAMDLQYTGSKYPVCSLFRVRKFLDRGWRITAGQMLKMCWQVSALDLTRVDVLEDQLTGVDVAYFQEIVSKLKERDTEKVDETYLFQLINQMM